ncbi:hypothetical protein Tco_0100861, partial [Tanacetum coccineum]
FDVSSSETIPEVTFDSTSECDIQRTLPPLPKLLGAEPSSILNSLSSLADLTLNMIVPKKTKQTSDKVSNVNITKRNIDSPFVPDSCHDKKTKLSTEKLLLTLMEEVKGLKEQIQTSLDISLFVSQSGSSKSTKGKQKLWFGPCKHCGFRNYLLEDCFLNPKCSTCGSTDHMTKEYPEHVEVKRTLAKLKAQSSQGPSRKSPMILKPYIPFKYWRFNYHHSDECEYYP